ncbi:MAG: hypothetical protein AB7E34_09720 [Acidaminococcaceae bacterium]
MKVNVTYYIPKVAVSKSIEIGDIINGRLSIEQNKMIDKLIKDELAPQLLVKFEKNSRAKIYLKTL